MTLLDLIDKNMIIVPLSSSKGEDIVRDLVERFCEVEKLDGAKCDEITKAVLEREKLGSTAMEKGIAIPHAKIPGLQKSAVAIGISRIPVDFGGEEKSRIFFLVLGNGENPSEHIQILSSIAKLCSSDVFVRMLQSSRTADDVYQLFFD